MKFLINLFNKCTQPIDFHGQKLVKKIIYGTFFIGFTLSFLLGIILDDLKFTLYGGIVTVAVLLVIAVPPWPMYRKNPGNFKKVTKTD